ncbi:MULTISPECIES: hypothetical protein [Brevibacillus]|jgi:hypothetical protein|uniref:hypothetical protein n=1 Tax=Brevibacillus TaxID=55080 RepID=UPI000A8A134B|nr:hypothetical protein [Brevibacillus borstelensis]MBE5395800.1 hypothetical protein [Brevibacillus borstelensis]MCC0563919.1 hypothetical protein [Brevibacillus borstelensis]MCM3469966.1 hypothetical protein [Brevibacillus borstelensis]MCM3558383.1 hypothetical protein [Brevibacillus borstelensis]MCM3590334.1 hypothetical protein [Brevibacillus borstelensis]
MLFEEVTNLFEKPPVPACLKEEFQIAEANIFYKNFTEEEKQNAATAVKRD